MDAPGIREELRDMARRLATVGYDVLLPNLYYRAGRDTVFGSGVLEEDSAERQRMRAIRTKMTILPVMQDIAANQRQLSADQLRFSRTVSSPQDRAASSAPGCITPNAICPRFVECRLFHCCGRAIS